MKEYYLNEYINTHKTFYKKNLYLVTKEGMCVIAEPLHVPNLYLIFEQVMNEIHTYLTAINDIHRWVVVGEPCNLCICTTEDDGYLLLKYEAIQNDT